MVDEGITALIGDVLTGNTLAVVAEAYPINMPMITASATAAEVTYDPDSDTVYSNVFRTCFIDPFQGEKMAEYASEILGAKTAAIIFETGNDYAVGLRDAFVAKAAELGVNVVAQEGFAKGDVDFKSQMTTIASKNPDVVFCPNYYENDGLIVTQAREVGVTAPFLGGDGWSGVSAYASAADLEGSVYCSAYAPQSSDAVKKFEADYEAEYGTDTLNMFAANAYDAAMVLCNALTIVEGKGLKAGSEEYKQAVIDAIRDNSGDLKGITSDGYSFDEYNNPIKSAVIMRLKDGKEVYDRMF
jgi:branched-chain amino acid transport system substrate-binding protein